MKIAFLILSLSDSGGAERTVSSLSGSFASKGNDVTVISLSGKTAFYDIDSRVHTEFLDLPKLPSGVSVKRLVAALKRAGAIRSAIKKVSPDVVIGMSHVMSAYAAFSTKFTHIKAVGTERSNPYLFNATKLMTLLRKAASLLCDGYVFQTRDAMGFFPKAAQKKSAVIHNAVFNPLVYSADIPDTRQKTITALGRVIPLKGFDNLISSCAAVFTDYPDYSLVIYGDGEETENLKSLANAKGIGDKVFFPGASADAIKHVATSSVFVLSSRLEGMPNALIEAMACGVPCVSTRCKMGPEELIIDGVNGLLVPVDDIDAMSAAIKRILSDSTLSLNLSRESVKIRKSHSLDAVTDKWLTYIKSL